MKNFTYRSLDEKDNIEAVLRQRKKKINRQQIIAAIIIFFILAIAALYAFDRSFYTQYDAYIHIETNKVRAPYDIYLDSVYVKPGDIVHIGDTLYSYYVMDWLVLEVNPNDEPSVLQNRRNFAMQISDLEQRIRVLEVRIAELRKQISLESHNISFGLSDNSHKMDLERELREAEALLRALRAQLAVLRALKNDAEFGPRGTNRARKGGTQIYENPYSKSDAYQIRYNISNKDGFITDVQAPMGMIFFEKEEIIDMQHLDLKDNNLMVVAYVPVNLTDKIKDNMPAKVYVNDELNFDAHVVMTGVRSEEIPEELRSYFTKANKALIAILTIDEGQIIPFWSATSGLPVQVKTRNLLPWEDEPEVKRTMLYEVGKGLLIKDSDGTLIPAGDLGKEKRALRDSIKTAEIRNRVDAPVEAKSGRTEAKKKPEGNSSSARGHKQSKNSKATKANNPSKPTPGPRTDTPAKTWKSKADAESKSATTAAGTRTMPEREKTDRAAKAEAKAKAGPGAKAERGADSEREEARTGRDAEKTYATTAGSTGRYIVISGVFQTQRRADIHLAELQEAGFSRAGYVHIGRRYYVYFNSFPTQEEAKGENNLIRKTSAKHAGSWVFDTER